MIFLDCQIIMTLSMFRLDQWTQLDANMHDLVLNVQFGTTYYIIADMLRPHIEIKFNYYPHVFYFISLLMIFWSSSQIRIENFLFDAPIGLPNLWILDCSLKDFRPLKMKFYQTYINWYEMSNNLLELLYKHSKQSTISFPH